MKIEVTCQPLFHLPLTLADAKLLQWLALAHYDGTCKGAGLCGGFIYGWINMLTPPGEEIPVSATWRQMDLTLKVLELRRSGLLHGRDADLKRADELNAILHTAMDHWQHRKPAPLDIDTAVGFNLPRSAR